MTARLRAPAIGLVALLAVLVLSPYQLGLLALIASYAIASLAQNLLSGYGDVPSLGNVSFFACGAFVCGGLLAAAGAPAAVAVLAGAAAAALLGLVVGLPALRISSMHLAIVTVVLVFVVQEVSAQWLVQHPSGVSATSPGWLQDERGLYIAAVTLAWCIYLLAGGFIRSRSGRALVALSENSHAAVACGVNPTRYRLLAFTLSGFLTGWAGIVYLYWARTVTPATFSLDLSLAFLTMVVIGGTRSLAGSLLGALIIGLLPELLAHVSLQIGHLSTQQAEPALYALLLLLTLRFFPDGLWNAVSAFRPIGRLAEPRN